MYNSLSYKSKQFFWLAIKLLIVIGCGYFIYSKLMNNVRFSFSDFYQNLMNNNLFATKNILFLFIFTIFNWFLEILKWKELVAFIRKISFLEASKQSLASLTTSLITPNRIGEYGAKALYFKIPKRKQILGLNFIGNFYQMMATLVFGFVGFSYFTWNNNIILNVNHVLLSVLFVILFFLSIYILIAKTKVGASYLEKAKQFHKKLPLKLNCKIAFISILRFLIFSHQFYFIALVFNLNIGYINTISAIFSIYFIASIIPILSLFDVVLKGTVAVWIFSFLNIDALTILSITTLMWLFNFVLPAILGSYFVLTFNPKFAK